MEINESRHQKELSITLESDLVKTAQPMKLIIKDGQLDNVMDLLEKSGLKLIVQKIDSVYPPIQSNPH